MNNRIYIYIFIRPIYVHNNAHIKEVKQLAAKEDEQQQQQAARH